jgi:hypothetical protein
MANRDLGVSGAAALLWIAPQGKIPIFIGMTRLIATQDPGLRPGDEKSSITIQPRTLRRPDASGTGRLAVVMTQ